MRPNSEYLGDGLYASHDGWQFWLETPEGNKVALEPDVLERFFDYVGKIYKGKVTIEPIKSAKSRGGS